MHETPQASEPKYARIDCFDEPVVLVDCELKARPWKLSGWDRYVIRERCVRHRVLFPALPMDPDSTDDTEPYGLMYDATPDSAFARIDRAVWVSRPEVEVEQHVPVHVPYPGRRRVMLPDCRLTEFAGWGEGDPDPDEIILLTDDDLAEAEEFSTWMQRDIREVAAERRRQRDRDPEIVSLADVRKRGKLPVKGAAAPRSSVEFDYERLLSNPDVPVKALRSKRGRLWHGRVLVDQRAFPGLHNLALYAQHTGRPLPQLQAWAKAEHHRFNVKRYVEAMASAFEDDPKQVLAFATASMKRQRKSWADLEAFLAAQHAGFAERCFISGVSEVDDSWMAREGENFHPHEISDGFGKESDIGHSVYLLPLVRTKRRRPVKPSLVVRDLRGNVLAVDPKPEAWVRPTHVRTKRLSERGEFTMAELVTGLLASVRRMEPLAEIPTVSEGRPWPRPDKRRLRLKYDPSLDSKRHAEFARVKAERKADREVYAILARWARAPLFDERGQMSLLPA